MCYVAHPIAATHSYIGKACDLRTATKRKPTALGESRLRVIGISIKLRLIRRSHTTGL